MIASPFLTSNRSSSRLRNRRRAPPFVRPTRVARRHHSCHILFRLTRVPHPPSYLTRTVLMAFLMDTTIKAKQCTPLPVPHMCLYFIQPHSYRKLTPFLPSSLLLFVNHSLRANVTCISEAPIRSLDDISRFARKWQYVTNLT